MPRILLNQKLEPTIHARRLFLEHSVFVCSAEEVVQLPEHTLPEIAFLGRSNVGKSSLINALTGRKKLAYVSKTPGKTTTLNLFDIGGRLRVMDLPGYGFARRSKRQRSAWQKLVQTYLYSRTCLRRVCLLVDARHDLKSSDIETFVRLEQNAVPFLVVATKCDKLTATEKILRAQLIEQHLSGYTAAFSQCLMVSCVTGENIDRLCLTLQHFI